MAENDFNYNIVSCAQTRSIDYLLVQSVVDWYVLAFEYQFCNCVYGSNVKVI